MAKTMEREVDCLYKIYDHQGKESLLHLEFQTKNNPEMLARMQEYHSLIYRRHRLPIRHIVVYLGKRKSTMKSVLEPDLIFSGFDIINISEIASNQLISSQIPEVVVMALLGDFKIDQLEKVLTSILKRLKSLTSSKEKLIKYINQLVILARIRNLEKIISQKLTTMPILYDVENDGLFLQGLEKGLKKGREEGRKEGREETRRETINEFALKMFRAGLSIEVISKTVELTVKEVKAIIKKGEAD
jgi:predicted transposase/invertase (TIGR01784 family)